MKKVITCFFFLMILLMGDVSLGQITQRNFLNKKEIKQKISNSQNKQSSSNFYDDDFLTGDTILFQAEMAKLKEKFLQNKKKHPYRGQKANEIDSLALVALYNATNGVGWMHQANWLTGPVGTWEGVILYGNDVGELYLCCDHLSGAIPPELGNLTNLVLLTLSNTYLSGVIPPELGNLTNLTLLNLEGNYLTGVIPPELGNLTNLTLLKLSYNDLTGVIPPEFGNLTTLSSLSLNNNQLTGNIPSELSNLTNLTLLNLEYNQLIGSIPVELGDLSNLQELSLYENNLSGNIPIELGNLINLESLVLYQNQLIGNIPMELSNLINLKSLYLNDNQLTGSIPIGLSNLTNLIYINFQNNLLTGNIPSEFGNLTNLSSLSLNNNQLTGNIPSEFGNLTNLSSLSLNNNQLTGNIPSELSNLNSSLSLSHNQLESPIPQSFCSAPYSIQHLDISNNLFDSQDCEIIHCLIRSISIAHSPQSNGYNFNTDCPYSDTDSLAMVALYNATDGDNWRHNTNWLTGPMNTWYGLYVYSYGYDVSQIHLDYNNLDGTLPASLGNLTHLNILNLPNNNLTGNIPPELGNLENLTRLSLRFNELTGNIPPELGNLLELTYLNLDTNNLSGIIPPELANLTNLGTLRLRNNQLNGIIPSELGDLLSLGTLYLSGNQLSGSIPIELGNLTQLYNLNLDNNQLSGSIPLELGNLTQLYHLNLSNNQLSGSIPIELGNLTQLYNFNLDNNQLSGSIPSEIGNIINLKELYLNNNQLSGNIPSEIGYMNKLWKLNLSSNQLESIIPESFCNNLSHLYHIKLDYNLFGFQDCPVIECMKERNFSTFEHSPQSNGFDFNIDCLTTETDSLALVALYNATNGNNWTNSANWLTGPIEDWFGVSLDENNRVAHLFLADNNMVGILPSDIGDLIKLTELSLTDNQLTGNIPAELESLTDIQLLYINENKFEGPIPQYFCNSLPNINHIKLDNNLFNSIDCQVIECLESRNLETLVHSPQFFGFDFNTGCSGVSHTDSLALVALYNATDGDNWNHNANWLTGPLHTWSGVILYGYNVGYLHLSYNNLDGTIPTELENLTYLEGLNISHNKLNGAIPKEIGNNPNLIHLFLDSNNLTGSIPTELSNLTNLISLDIADNQLESPIPSSICTGLPSIQNVKLRRNLFDVRDCLLIGCLESRNLNYFQHSPQSNDFNFNTDCQDCVATVYINPTTQEVITSNIFTTTIEVTNIDNLGGFELELPFNKDIIQANFVILGDFLGSTGRTILPLENTIDNDAGLIEFCVSTQGDTPLGPVGNGVLLTIEWTATDNLAADTTIDLILQNLQLTHPDGSTILFELVNATVTVVLHYVYDFDGDCDVDIIDITTVAYHYDTEIGDEYYDPNYDFDNDGDIDIVDITLVAYNYGWSCNAKKTSTINLENTKNDYVFMEFSSSEISNNTNGIYELALFIENIEQFGGYELELGFDANSIEVLSIENGGFMGSAKRKLFPIKNNIDNEKGKISYSVTSLGAEIDGANGKGTLLIIKCKSQNANNIAFDLIKAQLVRIDANVIDYTFKSFDSKINTTSIISTYPSPLKNNITVQYHLGQKGKVAFRFYNAYGGLVKTTESFNTEAGTYNRKFANINFSSGVYIISMEYNGSIVDSQWIIVN